MIFEVKINECGLYFQIINILSSFLSWVNKCLVLTETSSFACILSHLASWNHWSSAWSCLRSLLVYRLSTHAYISLCDLQLSWSLEDSCRDKHAVCINNFRKLLLYCLSHCHLTCLKRWLSLKLVSEYHSVKEIVFLRA